MTLQEYIIMVILYEGRCTALRVQITNVARVDTGVLVNK